MAMMSTNEADAVPDIGHALPPEAEAPFLDNVQERDLPDLPPAADLPTIPAIPASGSRRELAMRQFAEKLVTRMGPSSALWLAALIDEAVADAEHSRFGDLR
jgi:hypothetical protein